MSGVYYRPVVSMEAVRPRGALPVAGGWCHFDRLEKLRRGKPPVLVGTDDVPGDVLTRISAPRARLAGLDPARPLLMGILNVTPDSFSDGGAYLAPKDALAQARDMVAQGADILDIGGESTRPGAATVPDNEEIARVEPVIRALTGAGSVPVSIDTRKSAVARAALAAGAAIVNDVSGFTYDPDLVDVVAGSDAPVCLMHTQGTPDTMQDAPQYSDALLDVYDFLEARIRHAEAAGISRSRIMVDPGIGFGKTVEHCLELLRGISLFHSLGCAILLGVSRKSFIGAVAGVESAQDRVSGSVSVAMLAVGQGVQVLRVHDIAAHQQALALNRAVNGLEQDI
jgi:dihydropteroate synthase